jgi:B12-binding domain/radical SAM domain protein
MHSLAEDLPRFEELLKTIKPNFLLLGAMSICLPGAIACAKRAKLEFGDQICIILGGWHASETVYRNEHGQIQHHAGSPVRLMAEGTIDSVFDFVVSGQSEFLIAWLGENVRKGSLHIDASHIEELGQVPGDWILSWAESGREYAISSNHIPIKRNGLPVPCEMFGVRSAFDVFQGRLTAHVFSDTGNGCIYDCAFCSERSRATGGLQELETASDRLYAQFERAVSVIRSDTPSQKASAFVEDSTLLGGSKRQLTHLIELLSSGTLDLRFGGQLTIDQIIGRFDILRDLKSVGLDYLFVGLETSTPSAIGGLSKDVSVNGDSWLSRSYKAFDTLSSIELKIGIAVLFGLGESHTSRLDLIERVTQWRKAYGWPILMSLNWAVQHPLKGRDLGMGYNYTQWGIPAGPWVDAFADFGEASAIYPIAGHAPPILGEVQEVADRYREASNQVHNFEAEVDGTINR